MTTFPPLARATAAPPAAADPVRDVNLADFMAQVIEASNERPVIVDFWAPWCGPCKQLGPVLEKVVRSYNGAVQMAKVDIDKNPQIAQQMGVQSIPAVFAFFRGQPVDGFMGVQPEAQIKAWVERLVKATGTIAAEAGSADPASINAALKEAAEFLAAKDVPTAQGIYTNILDLEPGNAAAYAGLLRCLIALGDAGRAKQMLDNAPPDIAKDKALDGVRAAIDLAAQAAQTGPTAELEAKLQKNPADHQTRFDLALAHFAAGAKEKAVDELLEIVRRARTWNEDAARKQLVKLFEAFGPVDPLTISARKRLSSILFS